MAGPAKKAASPSLSSFIGDKKEDKTVDTADTTDVDKQPALEDNSDLENSDPENYLENTETDETKKDYTPPLSDQVVATVPNKTPAELAAETPDQTAARYGIDPTITDEDAENPRVQVYRDTKVNQVPSGTHLHPDIAKDLLNRGISEQHTDNAQVRRVTTEGYDFAPDAEYNDKFQKPVEENDLDRSDKYDADGNVRSDWKA